MITDFDCVYAYDHKVMLLMYVCMYVNEYKIVVSLCTRLLNSCRKLISCSNSDSLLIYIHTHACSSYLLFKKFVVQELIVQEKGRSTFSRGIDD